MRTLVICAIVAIAGCASTPAPNQTAQTAMKPPCLSTASRIPQSQSDCIAAGSVYSQQEIDRTGRQNPEVGNALQMLDPALQVHH
jgi:outer membrane cobalamin receptor